MRTKSGVTVDPASEVPGVVGVYPTIGMPGVVLEHQDGPELGTAVFMPLQEPEGGWPADEFTGVGGSYVRDPFTGQRSRVEPVAE